MQSQVQIIQTLYRLDGAVVLVTTYMALVEVNGAPVGYMVSQSSAAYYFVLASREVRCSPPVAPRAGSGVAQAPAVPEEPHVERAARPATQAPAQPYTPAAKRPREETHAPGAPPAKRVAASATAGALPAPQPTAAAAAYVYLPLVWQTALQVVQHVWHTPPPGMGACARTRLDALRLRVLAVRLARVGSRLRGVRGLPRARGELDRVRMLRGHFG
ncbi:hypothetical protein PsYK624_039960 [Phanerochaete sordida]|uniref:Uncharacterized protein n=1 Tax=Phanerochaete sordida TaxID=48140 RepID=A0A9P3LBC9_9APHY|nr:hypothetical protein PsYK624_039960 [Phanerochaete sordida]